MRSALKYYQEINNDASKGFQLFSICRQGVAFITGILLAKSLLSLEEIGTYEIWIYLGMLVSLMALSGAMQAFLSILPKVLQNQRRGVIFMTFLISWIATILLVLIIYFFRQVIFEQVLNIEIIPHLPWVLVFLSMHLVAALIPHIFLATDTPRAFIPFCVSYLLSGLTAIGLPLLFGGDLQWLLISLTIWAILEQLFLIYLIARFGEVKISISFIKTFLLAAFPLTLYAGSGMMAQVFDAWLVNHQYSSLSVFAIFKYGARELPGAIALASSFSAAMIVSYARTGVSGLMRIKEGSRRFMHVFFPISITLMLISKPLFALLYNVSFVESAMIFNTYLLIMVSRLLFPQAILIGMNKHNDVFIISLLELVVNVVLSLIFVRYFGLIGIALGTTLAFWLEKLIMITRLYLKYNISISDYAPIRALLIYSILLITSYYIAWL